MFEVLLEEICPELISAGVAEVRAVLVLEVKVPQGQCVVVSIQYGDARCAHNLKRHLVEPASSQNLLAGQLLLGQGPAPL